MPTRQHPKRSSGVILLVCLCAILFARDAHAQTEDSIPIQYGNTLTGTITESIPCQYYHFDGTQGDSITLDMTRISGTLDGVMALYWQDDFTRPPLTNNDDRPGGGLDPLIEFTLPETTWYTVAACRLQADQMRTTIGDYTLTLAGPGGAAPTSAPDTGAAAPQPTQESAPAAGEPAPTALPSLSNAIFGGSTTPTPAAAIASALPDGVETITAGNIVTGELAADTASVTYRLDAAAGDVVVVAWQRTDGDVAPMLYVTDANGRVLALAGTPDAVSLLTLVVLAPDGGALTITVTRYGATVDNPALDGTAGTFALVVDAGPAP